MVSDFSHLIGKRPKPLDFVKKNIKIANLGRKKQV
jgi:hypothetical protein